MMTISRRAVEGYIEVKPSKGDKAPAEGSAYFPGNADESSDRTGGNSPVIVGAHVQENRHDGALEHQPRQSLEPDDKGPTAKVRSKNFNSVPLMPGVNSRAADSFSGYGFDHKVNWNNLPIGNARRAIKRPGRPKLDIGIVEDGLQIVGDQLKSSKKSKQKKRELDKSKRSNKPHRDFKNSQTVASQETANQYAALDLGTNNCRLLIAVPEKKGKFRVVDAFSRIVRLGEGLEKSGKLSIEAMDRALDALIVCSNKLKNANIRHQRLIATEACRRALNGADFITRVKTRTGLDLEIIDRRTEAHLAAEGCCSLVDRKADGAVLFDIGGGSSELVLLDCNKGDRRKISELISTWTSLPIGVVTLSERHGGREVTPEIFQNMVEDVEAHLNEFEERNKLQDIWAKGRVHLLGTSGTVTTLAGVHLKLKRYDRRRIDGIWLGEEQVDSITRELLAMSFEQRAQNPCIGRDRADLVLAGCAILQAIRNTWPAPRLRVADRGLREGILTQMMVSDDAWANPNNHNNGKSRGNRSRNWRKQSNRKNSDKAINSTDQLQEKG